MYSLHLICGTHDTEHLSVALWDAGTLGIQEISGGDDLVQLIAAFESDEVKLELNERIQHLQRWWQQEDDIDWVSATEQAWPARAVGERLFLTPTWSAEPTPNGRHRVIHNPGMASGTGEHPCTQLALQLLERVVVQGDVVADVGTGSGILALAALRLGASRAAALDTDEAALQVARENAELNGLRLELIAGSADCVRSDFADVLVANINSSVLLAMKDQLHRIVKPGKVSILTGFPQNELAAMRTAFAAHEVLEQDGWGALISIWRPDVSSREA